MKKSTDEEKREMIDKACDLFNEANEKIMEGKRLMHLCGIEFCRGFKEGITYDYDSNLHIYSGIEELEKLTGSEVYFAENKCTWDPDLSYLYIKYKGLYFLQIGTVKTTNRKFSFR